MYTCIYIYIYHIISYHIISYHIISYHIISCHVMSCHVMSCHVMSCHIISYHIIPYHSIAYHSISYHIISYHIISYHIISYHIISYHIISYHIISYLYIWMSLQACFRHFAGTAASSSGDPGTTFKYKGSFWHGLGFKQSKCGFRPRVRKLVSTPFRSRNGANRAQIQDCSLICMVLGHVKATLWAAKCRTFFGYPDLFSHYPPLSGLPNVYPLDAHSFLCLVLHVISVWKTSARSWVSDICLLHAYRPLSAWMCAQQPWLGTKVICGFWTYRICQIRSTEKRSQQTRDVMLSLCQILRIRYAFRAFRKTKFIQYWRRVFLGRFLERLVFWGMGWSW